MYALDLTDEFDSVDGQRAKIAAGAVECLDSFPMTMRVRAERFFSVQRNRDYRNGNRKRNRTAHAPVAAKITKVNGIGAVASMKTRKKVVPGGASKIGDHSPHCQASSAGARRGIKLATDRSHDSDSVSKEVQLSAIPSSIVEKVNVNVFSSNDDFNKDGPPPPVEWDEEPSAVQMETEEHEEQQIDGQPFLVGEVRAGWEQMAPMANSVDGYRCLEDCAADLPYNVAGSLLPSLNLDPNDHNRAKEEEPSCIGVESIEGHPQSHPATALEYCKLSSRRSGDHSSRMHSSKNDIESSDPVKVETVCNERVGSDERILMSLDSSDGSSSTSGQPSEPSQTMTRNGEANIDGGDASLPKCRHQTVPVKEESVKLKLIASTTGEAPLEFSLLSRQQFSADGTETKTTDALLRMPVAMKSGVEPGSATACLQKTADASTTPTPAVCPAAAVRFSSPLELLSETALSSGAGGGAHVGYGSFLEHLNAIEDDPIGALSTCPVVQYEHRTTSPLSGGTSAIQPASTTYDGRYSDGTSDGRNSVKHAQPHDTGEWNRSLGSVQIAEDSESDFQTAHDEKDAPPQPRGSEVFTNNEHCFRDSAIGGVAVALTHGSVMFEVAKREVHATTAVRNPSRVRPTRVALIFYQHKNLHLSRHGSVVQSEKQKQRKQLEAAVASAAETSPKCKEEGKFNNNEAVSNEDANQNAAAGSGRKPDVKSEEVWTCPTSTSGAASSADYRWLWNAPVNHGYTLTTNTMVTKWIKPQLAVTGPYQSWG